MIIGPIHSIMKGATVGHQPIKTLKSSASHNTQPIVFDSAYPFAVMGDVIEFSVPTMFFESSQALVLQRMHQLEELQQNAEWQRCGVYIQWREDGINDGEDGWYLLKSVDMSEDIVFSGYTEPVIDVMLRARFANKIGMYVDAKTVASDISGGAVPIAFISGDFTAGNIYPATTYSFPASDGSTIYGIENPSSKISGQCTAPANLMSRGRCAVWDDGATRFGGVEQFHKDHRNINGYTRFTNGLICYTIYPAGNTTQPLIETYFSSAWATIGNFNLRSYSGSAYTQLPIQSFNITKLSPEEVIWEEQRFDNAGTGLVRVINRMRRGSKIIESSIISASGQGLVGQQSVQFTGVTGTPALTTSANADGVVFTGATGSALPGFVFLTTPGFAGLVSGTTANSGLTVSSGTISRMGIVAGAQDAIYTGAGSTGPLYAAKMASHLRSRVRQLLLVGV